MLAKDVLKILSKKHKSIAVVVDEYGGTSGVITVEDIIEELFGEIEDEHDNTALTEDVLGENEYRFSARLEVDYLNENYKLSLPEHEHYETLGGMIVSFTEGIPGKGEVVNVNDYTIEILEVSNTKIDLVSVKMHNTDL
jgi:putative hemolysin